MKSCKVPEELLAIFEKNGWKLQEGFQRCIISLSSPGTSVIPSTDTLRELAEIKELLKKPTVSTGVSKNQIDLLLEENNQLIALQVLSILSKAMYLKGTLHGTKGPMEVVLFPKIKKEVQLPEEPTPAQSD